MATNDHSTPDPGSLLDEKQFKSMGDALGDEFTDIISEYFASCGSFRNRLEEALGHGDLGEFRNVCHEIKGASGLIGFRRIAATVAAWEDTAASGRLPEEAGLIETFEHLVSETRACVGSMEK